LGGVDETVLGFESAAVVDSNTIPQQGDGVSYGPAEGLGGVILLGTEAHVVSCGRRRLGGGEVGCVLKVERIHEGFENGVPTVAETCDKGLELSNGGRAPSAGCRGTPANITGSAGVEYDVGRDTDKGGDLGEPQVATFLSGEIDGV